MPFASITIDQGAASLAVHGDDAVVAHIPFHGVRAVYKDGVVIWQRPGHTVL